MIKDSLNSLVVCSQLDCVDCGKEVIPAKPMRNPVKVSVMLPGGVGAAVGLTVGTAVGSEVSMGAIVGASDGATGGSVGMIKIGASVGITGAAVGMTGGAVGVTGGGIGRCYWRIGRSRWCSLHRHCEKHSVLAKLIGIIGKKERTSCQIGISQGVNRRASFSNENSIRIVARS